MDAPFIEITSFFAFAACAEPCRSTAFSDGENRPFEKKGLIGEILPDIKSYGQDLIFEMDQDDSITVSYTHGPGIDNPLSMTRNETDYYYLQDGLGSVTAITSEEGEVLQEYTYSVFGEILEQSADSIENRFTYTAREWDGEVGLFYYRNRFYNPQIGRFISEDPVGFAGGDINLYRYVYDNPTNFTDPEGLWVVQAIGTGLGAGFAAWQNYGDFKSGKISGATYAARIGFGGLTGLASTFGVGLWGNVAAGGLTAAANEMFTQATDPCSDEFNYKKIGMSGFFGGIVGGFAYGIGNYGAKFGYYSGGTPTIQKPVNINFHHYGLPAGTIGNVGGTWITNELNK